MEFVWFIEIRTRAATEAPLKAAKPEINKQANKNNYYNWLDQILECECLRDVSCDELGIFVKYYTNTKENVNKQMDYNIF